MLIHFARIAFVLFFVARSVKSAILVPSTDVTTGKSEIAREMVIGNGTDIEPRQVVQIAKVATKAIEGIIDIVNKIQDGIKKDNIARGDFTQHLVRDMHQKYPQFNWIICHVKHTTKFDGKQGVDWGHRHQEFDIKVGGTIGYEIYNFKSGEFWRKGDGGYLNWAYIGKVLKVDQNGKHIVFGKP
ncbi:hypothetical protein HGRIS_008926 [Hohenbuehelia grisea]|uniref:DUF7888 domain-containing protein n=1 Tax=Hohenbuehelia grisea TaxID=104357 RepID=A0ABR3IZJ5_9AGAR